LHSRQPPYSREPRFTSTSSSSPRAFGRLPSAHVDGHVMQASEKPAQFPDLHCRRSCAGQARSATH
jgi:hypothetical protein